MAGPSEINVNNLLTIRADELLFVTSTYIVQPFQHEAATLSERSPPSTL
jgi:hypothetical protein